MNNIFRFIWAMMIGLCCIGQTKAQNQQFTDSLLRLVEISKSDSQKAMYYLEIGTQYLMKGGTDGEAYLHSALAHAKRCEYKPCLMDANNRMGVLKFRKSDYDSSVIYYTNALKIALNESDSTRIVKFQGNIALIQSERGNYEEALNMLLQVCGYYRKKNPKAAAGKLLDMATLHFHMNNYQKAYDIAKEGRDLAASIPDSATLGNAWNSMGVFARELKNDTEGMLCFETAYAIQKQIDNKSGQCSALSNMADLLREQKKYTEAIEMLKLNVSLAESFHGFKEKAVALHGIGLLYRALGSLEISNNYLKNALQIFNDIKIPKLESEMALLLAKNHEKLGNYKLSTQYYKLQSELNDSLFKTSMSKSIAEMQTKYDTDIKEQENRILQKDNEINIIKIKKTNQNIRLVIYIAIFIISLLAIAYYFHVKQMKIKRKHALEQQLMAQQKLRLKEVVEAEEKERVRIAQELHDGLGQLLSIAKLNVSSIEESVSDEDVVLVQNAMQLIDQSVAEVRSISHNLMPATLTKYGLKEALQELIDKINDTGKIKAMFTCNLLESQLESQWILYRVAQELLNNALKYASASTIRLSIDTTDTNVIMKVEDDGVGIDQSVVTDKRGIGWRNIISRIEMLNGNVSVKSELGEGVLVTIEIPNEA